MPGEGVAERHQPICAKGERCEAPFRRQAPLRTCDLPGTLSLDWQRKYRHGYMRHASPTVNRPTADPGLT